MSCSIAICVSHALLQHKINKTVQTYNSQPSSFALISYVHTLPWASAVTPRAHRQGDELWGGMLLLFITHHLERYSISFNSYLPNFPFPILIQKPTNDLAKPTVGRQTKKVDKLNQPDVSSKLSELTHYNSPAHSRLLCLGKKLRKCAAAPKRNAQLWVQQSCKSCTFFYYCWLIQASIWGFSFFTYGLSTSQWKVSGIPCGRWDEEGVAIKLSSLIASIIFFRKEILSKVKKKRIFWPIGS